jgi:hypothetical protein
LYCGTGDPGKRAPVSCSVLILTADNLAGGIGFAVVQERGGQPITRASLRRSDGIDFHSQLEPHS